MTTEARILANRLNAQKSTGPSTPQGKAVVSQNAFKHGLSANRDVITTESQEDFDLHRDALLAELDLKTPMESMLADRIVSLSWRLKRADLIQNQTIDVLTEKDATNPLAKLAKSFGLSGLPIPQPDPADSNPDLILGRIALKDFSNERVLDRLLMYERRIEHSLFKTILELQRLRLLRNLKSSDQNSNQPKPPAPPFSRRRHLSRGDDDALTPNSNPPQSHIRLPRGGHTQHAIRLPRGGNTQNKPNSKNIKTAATSYTPNTYANIMLCPTRRKQTQSNPTCRGEAPGEAGFPTHDIRHPTSACPEGDIRNTQYACPVGACPLGGNTNLAQPPPGSHNMQPEAPQDVTGTI